MYIENILVKFEDGWTWPIFRGHGVNLEYVYDLTS